MIGTSATVTGPAGLAAHERRWDPWGGLLSSANPDPAVPAQSAGWAGEPDLAGAGLVHLRARDYDPATGQFVSVDPLVEATQEPYAYASGAPTVLSDPTGLWPCFDPYHINDDCTTLVESHPVGAQQVADFAGGLLDTISLRNGKNIMAPLTIHEQIDWESSSYGKGRFAGLLWTLPLAGKYPTTYAKASFLSSGVDTYQTCASDPLSAECLRVAGVNAFQSTVGMPFSRLGPMGGVFSGFLDLFNSSYFNFFYGKANRGNGT